MACELNVRKQSGQRLWETERSNQQKAPQSTIKTRCFSSHMYTIRRHNTQSVEEPTPARTHTHTHTQQVLVREHLTNAEKVRPSRSKTRERPPCQTQRPKGQRNASLALRCARDGASRVADTQPLQSKSLLSNTFKPAGERCVLMRFTSRANSHN